MTPTLTAAIAQLDPKEAAALEQVAGVAVNVFLNRQHNARVAIRHGGADWIAQHKIELADAKRLEAFARAVEKLAGRRALNRSDVKLSRKAAA